MEGILSVPNEGTRLSVVQKLRKFLKGPWFWGGVALIIGAVTSPLTLKYIFVFAWLVVCFGLWEAKFFEHQTPVLSFVGNLLLCIFAVLCTLHGQEFPSR